jgi:hypothetical protein
MRLPASPRRVPVARATACAAACFAPGLAAQCNWTLLAPAVSPPAFTAHAMAYDIVNDRTVLFGGLAGGVRYADTWLFDGAAWTQAAPATVPPARVAHSMAYDLGRARVVMFGGIPASGGVLGDTWEWDGTDWLLQAPAVSPSPRRSFPLVYHPGRSTTVLWGGYGTGDLGDMWEWDGVAWNPIATATSPAPRRASEMAYDPVTGGLLLFSGYLQGADTWLFNGTDWVQLAPATVPSARYDHAMATDLARNRLVMFGGPGAADTWEWDGSSWLSRTTTTLPQARSDTWLCYDWIRERVVMFGSVAVPETWVYAPTNPASYTTSGSGCPGTNTQAPLLATADRPWLGEPFEVTVSQLPAASLMVFLLGFSNTTWALGALPFDLAVFGMPGCLLQVDPAGSVFVAGSGGSATWSLGVPNNAGLLGLQFHNQAGAIDPGANAAGFTVSNAGAGLIGGK